MISYSAPAKIILSGEHGVVYGKPALAVAIDKRLTCSITGLAKAKQDDSTMHVIAKVKEWLEKKGYKISKPDPHLHIKSDIPCGRGMGSSAAYSVACAAAIYEYFTGEKPEKQMVNDIAYRIEKKFHTNPSGVDVSASCFGGLIYYRKEFEFLKTISALNIKIPKKIEERLLLIDTGKPAESTAEMVGLVGRRYNKEPEVIRGLFEQMERITKRMVVSLVKEDVRMFTECISENQQLLHQVGVVSKSTAELLQDLQKVGTGKITGAGGVSRGSGYMLFLPSDHTRPEEYLNRHNIRLMEFHQDFEGLRREVAAAV